MADIEGEIQEIKRHVAIVASQQEKTQKDQRDAEDVLLMSRYVLIREHDNT